MLALSDDFPDLAADIVDASRSNESLEEALNDYEQVCKQLRDADVSPEERAQWDEIRAELVAEIGQIFFSIGKKRGEEHDQQ